MPCSVCRGLRASYPTNSMPNELLRAYRAYRNDYVRVGKGRLRLYFLD